MLGWKGYTFVGDEKFTVLNNEVITRGYNPGVVGVIDAELSELWGYKVILRVDGVYNPVTPGLSELLTRSYNPVTATTPGYNSDNSA